MNADEREAGLLPVLDAESQRVLRALILESIPAGWRCLSPLWRPQEQRERTEAGKADLLLVAFTLLSVFVILAFALAVTVMWIEAP